MKWREKNATGDIRSEEEEAKAIDTAHPVERETSRTGRKVVRREVDGRRERAALWDAAERQQLLD